MTRSSLLLATVSSAALLLAQPAIAENPASLTVGGGEATGEVLGASEISGVTFTAGPGETRELVFPDGTSIVMSEGSSFTVERYSFSPTDGTGELRISLGPGLFKITGGELNTTTPIVLSAGGAEVLLDNAGAVVDVSPDGSVRTYKTVGKAVTLATGGSTETLRRNGFQTSCACNGDTPASPTRMTGEDYSADLAALRPKGGAVRTESVAASSELAGSSKLAGTGSGGASQNPANRVAQDAQQDTSTPIVDTLAANNVGAGGSGIGGVSGSGSTGGGNTVGGTTTTPPPPPPPEPPFTRSAFDAALTEANATDGTGVDLPNASGSSGSITDFNAFFALRQNNEWIGDRSDPLNEEVVLEPRGRGPTTNRFLSDDGLSVAIGGADLDIGFLAENPAAANPTITPQLVTDAGVESLTYLFGDDGQFLLDDQFNVSTNFGILGRVPLPTTEGQSVTDTFTVLGQFSGTNGPFDNGTRSVLQTGFGSISVADFAPPPAGPEIPITGTDTELDTFLVSQVEGNWSATNEARNIAYRLPDNFVFVQMTETATTSGDANFIFSAGDVDGPFTTPSEIRVDRFFTSPGLIGFDDQQAAAPGGGLRGVADGSRAFLRPDTVFGGTLEDNGVLVVNRTTTPATTSRDAAIYSGGVTAAQVLHADFAISGTGAGQTSTFSITAGDVDRQQVIPGDLVEVSHLDATSGLTPAQLAALDSAAVGTVVAGTNLYKLQENGSRADYLARVNATLDPGDPPLTLDDVGVPDVFAEAPGGALNRTATTPYASPTDAFLDAVTLGTTRRTGTEAPIHLTSRSSSTSAGGGNPNLVDGSSNVLTGVPGYFTVENFDLQAEGTAPVDARGRSTNGGLEEPLGEAGTPTRFANLRLLSATGSLDGAVAADDASADTVNTLNRTGGERTGFAAGLSEFEVDGTNTIQVAFADGFTNAGLPFSADDLVTSNFSFTPDTGASTLSATLRLTDPDGTPYQVDIGGASGESAFVDNDTFGALVAGDADFGFVTGNMITVDPEDDGIRSLPGLDTISSTAGSPFLGENLNQFEDSPHLAWGVFLGDRIWDPATGRREHIHLGSWVAGDPVDPTQYLGFTGVATYEGHALGNVYDGTSVSTVVGRFQNSWDFGGAGNLGSGSMQLDFDGQLYNGTTRFKSGQGFVSSDLASAQGRSGRIDGDFYGISGTAPAAVGGQFGLQGASGEVYGAAGTFAGSAR